MILTTSFFHILRTVGQRFADTYIGKASELVQHDHLATRAAQRCGPSETAGCEYQAVFGEITYRLLLKRDTSPLFWSDPECRVFHGRTQ